jgi:signal transduction histidine kinase/ActR/RegA family two-component response regulator
MSSLTHASESTDSQTDRGEARWLSLLQESSRYQGVGFLDWLCELLYEQFGKRFAFVAEVIPGHRARTLALFAGGEMQDEYIYELRGTPCDLVFARQRGHFPTKVADRFPEGAFLVDNDVDSYLAIPLINSKKEPVGILGILDGAPMPDCEPIFEVLDGFAGRCGTEIERIQTERFLEQALAQAQAASKYKSQFLANMSHEIRTPMNAILGMTEISLERVEDESIRSYLQIVQESGGMLLRLIDDILDFSKIEAGHLRLARSEVDLRDTLRRTIAMMETAAREKGVALEGDVDESLPAAIVSDGNRIGQVLLNLLGNAIKFTPPGGCVRLTAKSDQKSGQRAYLSFTVEDNGIGIPQERLDVVFQAFAQADFSTTRVHGGTGLGLAISRQLAQMMHGDITVESSVGQGSKFCFQMLCEVAGDISDAPRQSLDEGAVFVGSGQRVLLVEDNRMNQVVACLMLESMNLVVSLATTGREAIAMHREDPFDLILMDCQMPVMDGYQATAEIRRMEEEGTPGVPIIAITANALAGDREKCISYGMDEYLPKPVTKASVSQVLRRQLPNRD